MTLRNAFDSCEKLTVFPLNSVSNSLSYDIVRFKIKVGVEEKFMCKNVSKQMQHAHCDVAITLLLCQHPCYDVSSGTVDNCRVSQNQIACLKVSSRRITWRKKGDVILSAEERHTLLKLLWGLVDARIMLTILLFTITKRRLLPKSNTRYTLTKPNLYFLSMF